MVWCAGYLTHQELGTFLKKAKARLMTKKVRTTRQAAPESFIILLDNVLEDDELQEMVKG